MHLLSIDVAEHALRQHRAIRGDDRSPYRIRTTPGFVPQSRQAFVDMMGVRDALHARAGRRVSVRPAFRLQQWLIAEAMIRTHWPAHQSQVVPRQLLAGLSYNGLPTDTLPMGIHDAGPTA